MILRAHGKKQKYLKDSATQQDLIMKHVTADISMSCIRKKVGRPHERTVMCCGQNLFGIPVFSDIKPRLYVNYSGMDEMNYAFEE